MDEENFGAKERGDFSREQWDSAWDAIVAERPEGYLAYQRERRTICQMTPSEFLKLCEREEELNRVFEEDWDNRTSGGQDIYG